MIDHNIVRGSKIPDTSPLILVQKPSDKENITWIDFRKMIAIRDRDSYQPPKAINNLDCLLAPKYFIELYLFSWYWKTEIE